VSKTLDLDEPFVWVAALVALLIVATVGLLIGMESGYISKPKSAIERVAEKDGVTIYRISNGRYYGVDANGNGFGLE
jgi:hypothetical protein